MSEEYTEENLPEQQGSQLIPQLGTSSRKLGDGDIDMRLLTVIMDPTDVPTSLRPVLYAMTRDNVTRDGMPFWKSLVDNYLHLMVGIGGRGRRDLIRGEQVSRGQAVNVESEIREPGFIQKYLTKRNWEQEERQRLGLE